MAIVRCNQPRPLPALLLLLLVLSPSVSSDKKQKKRSGDGVDVTGSALVDWIRASGGHSDVRVGFVVDAPPGAEPTSTKTATEKRKTRKKRRGKKESSSSSALRGTIATRDIAAGDVIIRLPSNISVPLGGTGVTSPVRSSCFQRCSSERCFFSLLLSSLAVFVARISSTTMPVVFLCSLLGLD